MSIYTRPNFHAVRFEVEVIKSMRSALRGPQVKYVRKHLIEKLKNTIMEFVENVNDGVDELARKADEEKKKNVKSGID